MMNSCIENELQNEETVKVENIKDKLPTVSVNLHDIIPNLSIAQLEKLKGQIPKLQLKKYIVQRYENQDIMRTLERNYTPEITTETLMNGQQVSTTCAHTCSLCNEQKQQSSLPFRKSRFYDAYVMLQEICDYADLCILQRPLIHNIACKTRIIKRFHSSYINVDKCYSVSVTVLDIPYEHQSLTRTVCNVEIKTGRHSTPCPIISKKIAYLLTEL